MQKPPSAGEIGLPTGTVTFLFTDIEGSSRMWEADAAAARLALRKHDELVIGGIETAGGLVVKSRGEGDSHFAVFSRTGDAVTAAVTVQLALAAEKWPTEKPVRVRMALHTGEAEMRMGDYYGRAVNRCARIRAVGHGGQILLSQASAEMVREQLPPDCALRDFGQHRLKDLSRPEQIFQIAVQGLRNEFPPLKSLNLVTHNLPAQATSFIGREREVEEVTALLARDDVRLITFLGPGGTGKTRLSLEVGRQMIGRYPDGVFFIPLEDATDTDLVVSKTARALEVRESGNQPPLVTLETYLRDKQMLLLLDNFEQVVSAAGVISELLAVAPRLKIIATSRALLNLRSEFNYPVPTLSLPAAGGSITLWSLEENEATRLFLERAAAANPQLYINDENAVLVAEICQRLDGLPLAIELAAARVRMLSLDSLLARLSERLKILTGGARDLPRRQQTLRGAIDWSYDLLAKEERLLLARLSVFAGGFTLESAEAVCAIGADLDVFAGVEMLLDQSLLKQQALADGTNRFYMLEAIREYAAERLAESGETDLLQNRHSQYFIQKMQVIGFAYYSPDALNALNWTDREHDNLRAILGRSLASQEHSELVPDIVLALIWYWYRRGFVSEGRSWTERLLATFTGEQRTLARSRLLGSAAAMAMWQGELNDALAYAAEGVAVAHWLEDPFSLSITLMENGIVHLNMGNDNQARDLLHQSLAIYSQMGFAFFEATVLVHLANASLGLGDFAGAAARLDEATAIGSQVNEPWLHSFTLNNRGEVARAQGLYDEARGYYIESERILREIGDTGDLARLVHTLGYINQHEGHLTQATERFLESLAMFQKVGNQRGIAECLAGLSGLLAQQGRPEEGVQLLAAAAATQDITGAAWWPADRVEIERNANAMRAALDDASFVRAQEAGRKMTMDEAVAFALENIAAD